MKTDGGGRDRWGRDSRATRAVSLSIRSGAFAAMLLLFGAASGCGGSSPSGDRDAGIDTRSTGSGGLIGSGGIGGATMQTGMGGGPGVGGFLDGGAGAGDGGAVGT